jgi:hypothetical protein
VQASHAQIIAGLQSLQAVEIGNYWRVVDGRFLQGLLDEILLTAIQHDWDLKLLHISPDVKRELDHRSSMGLGTFLIVGSGTFLIFGLGAGAVKQMHKITRTCLEDKKARESLDPKECIAFEGKPPEDSQVVSCIIEGVYQGWKQKKAKYVDNNEEHWEHWGYKLVGFDILAGAYNEVVEDRRRVGDRGQSGAQAMFFERIDSQVFGSYINLSKNLILPFCVVQWH